MTAGDRSGRLQAERMQKNCLEAPDTASGTQSTHSAMVCWVSLSVKYLRNTVRHMASPTGAGMARARPGGVFSRFSHSFCSTTKKSGPGNGPEIGNNSPQCKPVHSPYYRKQLEFCVGDPSSTEDSEIEGGGGHSIVMMR